MAKSDSYQYRLIEITGITPQRFANYSNDDGIGAHIEANCVSDEIIALQKELVKRIIYLINNKLTPHQTKVMNLHLAGNSQKEIANECGNTQSAVCKCLYGNQDFTRRDKNGEPKRYGGCIKRLIKLSKKDAEIQIILMRIRQSKDGD